MRRRFPWWLVFLAFLVLPIIEIYVIIQVGQVIGAWWTVLLLIVEIYVIIQVGQVIGAWWTVVLLIADSLFGSWLLKREGVRSWQALQATLTEGRIPAKELADAGLIVFGGTLMITPGFVTDIFGLLAILPFTRPVARRLLIAAVARRFLVVRETRRPGPPDDVVQGEVVDP